MKAKGLRPVCDIDPLLVATMRELAAKYGKEAVLAAAQAVGKREFNPDATRIQNERLAGIINALLGVWTRDDVFRFMRLQMTAKVPTETSLDILDRVVSVKAANPWALINRIMRDDYPHYKWGRG
jgi:hypothetical protein